MSETSWFSDPIIGRLPPDQLSATLRAVGEEQAAQMIEAANHTSVFATMYGEQKFIWPFQDRAWQHTSHVFGYLAPDTANQDLMRIYSIDSVQADPTLKYAQLKITLDRLRVVDYPGRGIHRVLIHFFAQNQIAGQVEPAHFNATYRVREGQQAALRGYPIFVGLCVGGEGLLIRCRTINVQNEQDTSILDLLESDVFQAGLQLASAMQPALVPLSALGLGLAKLISQRHNNVPVQDFALGLDFGITPMGARLAEGNYLAVQVPEGLERIWDWDEWSYHRPSGQIVKTSDHQNFIRNNYLVFGISRLQSN